MTLEERVAALEAEVKHLRDDVAIRQLIMSYGPMVDTADTKERADRVAELWVKDGVYDVGGIGRHAGRGEISASFEGFHFDMVHTGCAHMMIAPFIRINGDTATALSYSCVFRPDGERFYPWRVSTNLWEFIRRDGKWVVTNRVNRLMRGDDAAQAVLRNIDKLVD